MFGFPSFSTGSAKPRRPRGAIAPPGNGLPCGCNTSASTRRASSRERNKFFVYAPFQAIESENALVCLNEKVERVRRGRLDGFTITDVTEMRPNDTPDVMEHGHKSPSRATRVLPRIQPFKILLIPISLYLIGVCCWGTGLTDV